MTRSGGDVQHEFEFNALSPERAGGGGMGGIDL